MALLLPGLVAWSVTALYWGRRDCEIEAKQKLSNSFVVSATIRTLTATELLEEPKPNDRI